MPKGMLFRWHTLLAMRKTRTVGATITPTSLNTTESTLHGVVFSDRQKELEADTTLTEVVLHQALCVKHLVNNVVTQTKIPQRNASTVVWKLAKTECREEAEQYLREIKQTYGPDTHKYLLDTGAATLVRPKTYPAGEHTPPTQLRVQTRFFAKRDRVVSCRS